MLPKKSSVFRLFLYEIANGTYLFIIELQISRQPVQHFLLRVHLGVVILAIDVHGGINLIKVRHPAPAMLAAGEIAVTVFHIHMMNCLDGRPGETTAVACSLLWILLSEIPDNRPKPPKPFFQHLSQPF